MTPHGLGVKGRPKEVVAELIQIYPHRKEEIEAYFTELKTNTHCDVGELISDGGMGKGKSCQRGRKEKFRTTVVP